MIPELLNELEEWVEKFGIRSALTQCYYRAKMEAYREQMKDIADMGKPKARATTVGTRQQQTCQQARKTSESSSRMDVAAPNKAADREAVRTVEQAGAKPRAIGNPKEPKC